MKEKVKTSIVNILLVGIILTIVTITYFLTNTHEVLAKVEKKVTKVNYKVDIKGAVTNPGVYKLKDGSRVIDVINAAGGIVEGANLDYINLAKKISDEMVIIIYTNEQIANYNESKKEYVYIEVNNCPDPVNDACVCKENAYNGEVTEEVTEVVSSKININTASLEQLTTLTGIGESKAKSIIEYRNQTKFETIEDIKNVSGIGDSAFEKIKDSITV